MRIVDYVRSLFRKSDPDEILVRYPPFAQGFPAYSIEKILSGQEDLILRIKRQIGIGEDNFEELIMSSIKNYAAYVHLLPASQYDHHKGMGGLFRHGLEVGLQALVMSESYQMGIRALTPTEKNERTISWRCAAFLAGMSHDLGKIILEISVQAHDTDYEWNPYATSMYEYLKETKQSKYQISWRQGRGKNDHEAFSLLLLERIASKNLWKTLSGNEKHRSSDIMQQLLVAVKGIDGVSETETAKQIYQLALLVKQADMASVREDKLAMAREDSTHGSVASPVVQLVTSSIKDLAAKGKWNVSENGSPMWYAALEGETPKLYMNFQAVYKDVLDDLSSKGLIKSVPSNHERTLDILHEAGYFKDIDGVMMQYILPESLSGKIKSLAVVEVDNPLAVYSALSTLKVEKLLPTTLREETKHEPKEPEPTQAPVQPAVQSEPNILDHNELTTSSDEPSLDEFGDEPLIETIKPATNTKPVKADNQTKKAVEKTAERKINSEASADPEEVERLIEAGLDLIDLTTAKSVGKVTQVEHPSALKAMSEKLSLSMSEIMTQIKPYLVSPQMPVKSSEKGSYIELNVSLATLKMINTNVVKPVSKKAAKPADAKQEIKQEVKQEAKAEVTKEVDHDKLMLSLISDINEGCSTYIVDMVVNGFGTETHKKLLADGVSRTKINEYFVTTDRKTWRVKNNAV